MQDYSRAWLTDFVLAGLTIIGCGFGSNLALEIRYGISDISYSGVPSIVICGILLLLLIVYIVVWIKDSPLFTEYHKILNTKSRVEFMFTILYSYSGLIIGFTTFMLFSYQYVTTIIICYSLLLFLFVQFKQIYGKSRQTVRVQVNLLTIVLIQSVYLVDNYYHGYNHLFTSKLLMSGTMLIPLVIAINLIVNLAFLAYQSVQTIRHWLAERTKKRLQNQQK